MTKQEFAACMKYLAAGTGCDMPKERAEVYWDMLKEMPLDLLQIACKRSLLSHPWKTFPSVAELVGAASETRREAMGNISGSEAWELASRAAAKIDPDIDGSMDRHMARLPAVVQKAMRRYGVVALCYLKKKDVEHARHKFGQFFAEVVAEEQRNLFLPPALQKQIESLGKAALPAPAQAALKIIGTEK